MFLFDSIKIESSINDVGKSIVNEFIESSGLIETTSVLKYRKETEPNPKKIINKNMIVLLEMGWAFGFFDLNTRLFLTLLFLLLFLFAKSFISLHFLHRADA